MQFQYTDSDTHDLWYAATFAHSDICLDMLRKHTSATNQLRADPGYIDALCISSTPSSRTTPLYSTIYWSAWADEEECFVIDHLNTARHLVRYGADVSAANGDGATPLHAAIARDCRVIEFLDVLLNSPHPRNLEVKFQGETPLLMAVSNTLYNRGHEPPQLYKEQVDMLLRHGADVHTLDNLGNSLLHHKGINAWLVRKFLVYGADINRPGEGGRTPLHQAVYRGRLDLSPRYAHTPIDYAENVRMFLDAGCDIDLKDDRGRTAEDIALRHLDEEHPVCVLLVGERLTREARLAFASGSHNRSGSSLRQFDPDMMRMILDPHYFSR